MRNLAGAVLALLAVHDGLLIAILLAVYPLVAATLSHRRVVMALDGADSKDRAAILRAGRPRPW